MTRLASVSREGLHQHIAALLAEPLVAQRLITAGQRGLALLDGISADQELKQWGHTLASAVAVLLPAPGDPTTPADRRKRRKYQEQWLNGQVHWPDLASTANTAYLLCVDNRQPELGLPRQLYPKQTPEALLDFEGFYPLLDALILAVSPVAAPAWLSTKTGLREALVTIIAETFKNTHDHARQEVDKSDVAQSLRGLYARFYDPFEISALDKATRLEDVTPALRYARSFLPKPLPAGVRAPQRVSVGGILEISIFDSGPGMAAKWLKRPVAGVPAKDQLAALVACFEKGRTTTGTQGRGYGLAKVLLKLRELRGFVSVRTNEIHVFRQFADHAGIAHNELPDGTRVPNERLFDWKLGFAPLPSVRQAVRGTVVSFLIPMAGA